MLPAEQGFVRDRERPFENIRQRSSLELTIAMVNHRQFLYPWYLLQLTRSKCSRT